MATPPLPNRPELLAPAGNLEKLETAILYGADAVYLGGPDLNLRASAAGFRGEELAKGLDLAHGAGVRAYYLLNLLPRENLLDKVRARLDELGELAAQGHGPDAIIAADPGVVRMIRRRLPDMPVHVSTQANTANSESVRFWSDLGARRVNVAREVRSAELKEMLAVCRHDSDGGCGAQLEVFVHGAQCMAVSGQCHLSAYLNDRPGNLGQCSHPCRYEYRPRALLLEEATRPGEDLWEVRTLAQDCGTDGGEPYTALFAAHDLCLVHYLQWMARMGVAAVKIEGRTKSSSYLAQVTDAYATALDQAVVRAVDPSARYSPEACLAEMVNASSRPLSTGFFDVGNKGPAGDWKIIARPPEPENARPVLARILEDRGNGRWLVEVKHTWKVVDTPVEMLVPGLERPRLPGEEFGLENADGMGLDQAHPGMRVTLICDRPELRAGLFLRTAWRMD